MILEPYVDQRMGMRNAKKQVVTLLPLMKMKKVEFTSLLCIGPHN